MTSTDRASHWSVTINNPTATEHEQVALARQKGWKITGQEEVGKEGTPHLQLHLATPQVRFSAVKKAFPRAHIQVARNPIALEAYVNKTDTRVAPLPVASDRYPSLSKFWVLVYERIEARNWLSHSTTQFTEWWRDAFDDLRYSRIDYSRPVREETAREFAMLVLDEVVKELIYDGYHIDQFYSPPNQNLWKKFHFAILSRSRAEKDAQTDRQTDEPRLEVTVPILAEEYNDAVSSPLPSYPPSPQAPPR